MALNNRSQELAPGWHTGLLLALIVSVAVLGALLSWRGAPVAPSGPRVLSAYLPMITVQCVLALYVVRVGRGHSALSSLVGTRWTSLGRALGDVALALVACALMMVAEGVWEHRFGVHQSAALGAILPHNSAERAAWVVVAVSVGLSEELVYRGYLQTQLAGFTRHPALGLLLSATLFGIAHGERGVATAARVGIYGLALGALTLWRRSLVPGMLAHVALDLASGLLRAP